MEDSEGGVTEFERRSLDYLKMEEVLEYPGMAAVEYVLWDDAIGAWFDYDLETLSGTKLFSAANISP
ncbi:trehalase family glycosidase, partial [Salmonella sp. s51884]|uniref:trehalase family glycosidase n=1 Tax=Salmonella sp. s51884 TaxID=3159654 RepID=UPI00397EF419